MVYDVFRSFVCLKIIELEMSTAAENQKQKSLLVLAYDALSRETTGYMLSVEPDFQVVARCASIVEAVEILKRGAIDVVLLDFGMGWREAEEAETFMHEARPWSLTGKVLLVAGEIEGADAARIAQTGIYGIFHKGDSAASLSQVVRHVAAGNLWFSRRQLQRVLTPAVDGTAISAHSALTVRQRRVLVLVAEGLKNRDIGAQIGVSEGSVKATIQQLFSRFGVRSRCELVRIGLQQPKVGHAASEPEK